MAQLSHDCFATGAELLPLAQARALIAERVGCAVAAETVALAEADGRVLADDLVAGLDLPAFDNSAVDGFAVRSADLCGRRPTRLAVIGRITAGEAAPPLPAAPVAVRIFTGAPMPAGFDTVYMQEDARFADGMVELPPGLTAGANRRRAGEDLARGAVALAAGRRLSPADLALAAALGASGLAVRERLKVALFSTGNEVVEPGAPLGPAQVHDANRAMLAALMRRAGAEVSDLGILPDRPAALAEALAAVARRHHLILTSGGVSTGEEDHVRAAVERVGALTFWRVAVKPGRPVALGTIAGTPFVGLPGNPVAVYVTFVQLARALIARLSGEDWQPPAPLPVRAGFSHAKKTGRREYLRVRLVAGEDGPTAVAHPREGAGVITSLTETDGLVELGDEATGIEPGATVAFFPYAVLA